MRIVSLIASATEIVTALGAQEHLVGRSHECDFPDTVSTLPVLTRPRFDTSLDSYSIDTAVKNLVDDGLSVYDIDRDALRSLSPDVIITQDQCEVCAASLEEVEAAVCDWVGEAVRLVSLHPDTLADVMTDIETVGAAIRGENEAAMLVRNLNERLNAIRTKESDQVASTPSVLVMEWIDPPMAAGHWIPALVEIAGGGNLIARKGGPSPYITWKEISDADPDIIVVAPCGFDLDRTEQEMAVLAKEPKWGALRAVRSGRIAIMDGNRFVNRPSPAVLESTAMLHDIINYGEPRRGPCAWRWFP